jgi:3-carboxy-cis,cis-muconate cycloisomerase
MAGSVFDSALLARLFPTGDVGRLFTDSAEIRAMLLVEGALAKVQGDMGVIPEISAAAIHRAAMEVQIDPGALASATGQNGVCVPALVAAFRSEMNAPEHAQYVHWGATSQDIIDTGLMLRLRQGLTLIEADAKATLAALAHLAERFADLPMAARTYGQHATPTSFGGQVAEWGAPLLDALKRLDALRDMLCVSVGGAAGTGAAYGDVTATRTALAAALDLSDPGRSWHTDRAPIRHIAAWCQDVTQAMAKMGRDLTALVQTGIAEVHLSAGGASSTMPQKQNPVAPETLVALATLVRALAPGLAVPHAHQRDGSAWFTEWMVLPQIVLAAAASAQIAKDLTPRIEPDAAAMAKGFESGLIHAEALSFALAATMPRPEAQALVKSLARKAAESGEPLAIVAAREHPALEQSLFDPAQQMGAAPQSARAFAAAVTAVIG